MIKYSNGNAKYLKIIYSKCLEKLCMAMLAGAARYYLTISVFYISLIVGLEENRGDKMGNKLRRVML